MWPLSYPLCRRVFGLPPVEILGDARVHDPVAKLEILKWYLYVFLLVAMVVLLSLPGQSDTMLRELHEIKCCPVVHPAGLVAQPAILVLLARAANQSSVPRVSRDRLKTVER